MPLLPPPAIARGLRGLHNVADCEVEEGPLFDERAKRWIVGITLRRGAGSEFVGASTRWCALLDSNYPFGGISFYPAATGGLTATFPHQSRNTPEIDQRGWRSGKLCLDTPFGGERRVTLGRDPIGDTYGRLRWHVERALEWLHRAAHDQLRMPGDPFELPDRPHTTVREWERQRVIHEENATSLAAWAGQEYRFGVVHFGLIPEIGNAIGIRSFTDRQGSVVRAWTGRELSELGRAAVLGFWWLWPQPIVLRPWQAPGTWGELRRIARSMGFDVDATLRWLLPQMRGAPGSSILMLGYPIPVRVGGSASEVHWDALLLPRLAEAAGQPRGFRPNARGWWHRDRYGKFGDRVSLEYLCTENWSSERLQARGRLPSEMRERRVALLGAGASGSALAEMLVRAGVKDIALADEDVLMAGNVCRHAATLVDVGEFKAKAVARRLRQISPLVRVTEFLEKVSGTPSAISEKLDEFDVIVDCTSSDELLALLAKAWWSIPRVFASFSMGYGAKRIFSYGVVGHRFPQEDFAKSVRPWLEHEAKTWAESDEVLEGAGCWSPLFPARFDHVMLAAATCVRELETLVAKWPTAPRFRVFAQSSSEDGFQGLRLESTPPLVEAEAS